MKKSITGPKVRGARAGAKLPQIANGEDAAAGANMDQSGGPNNSVIGVCSEQGKRPYQEDEYAVHLSLQSKSGTSKPAPETHFFGLYDGHAGGKCSKFVASNLPEILMEDAAYLSNMSQAIKRAYLTTNEQFLKIAEKMKLHDGSTGITCIVRDGLLTVANVGDCRALVISGGRAIQLSVDQKPTSIEEQRRIALLGGTVVNCMGVARVNGILAVSRAFGNRSLKQVIRPDAEITVRELQRDDEFLVMASDGLWDVLKNKDVSDIVYQLISCSCQNIAEELVHTALIRGSMDNVTCVVVRIDGFVKPRERATQGAATGTYASMTAANAATTTSTAAAVSKANEDFIRESTADEGSIIMGSWDQEGYLSRSSSFGNSSFLRRMDGGEDDDNVSFIQPNASFDFNQFASGQIKQSGMQKSANDYNPSGGRPPSSSKLSLQIPNGAGNGYNSLNIGGILLAPPLQSPIQTVSKRPNTVGTVKQGSGSFGGMNGYSYRGAAMGANYGQQGNDSNNFSFNNSANSNSNNRVQSRQYNSSPISFDYAPGAAQLANNANMARPGTTAAYGGANGLFSMSTPVSLGSTAGVHAAPRSGLMSTGQNNGGNVVNTSGLFTSGYQSIKKLSQMQSRP